jgi:methyltransferase (TIGR00027 family)
MGNPAAQTAFGPMVVVAVEQQHPADQRLLQDEYACQYLPPTIRFFVKLARWSLVRVLISNILEKRARGVWGGVLCRKRYNSDKAQEAVREGVRTIVILGAGLDTLAYRLAAMAEIAVFEVDFPENIEYKITRLQQVFGSVPDYVTFVSTDFENQELRDVLSAAGYTAEHQALFVVEAVTQYLSEAAVLQLFRFLAQAKAGSRLLFTYIHKDFIEGANTFGLDTMYQQYRVKRPLWRFGIYPNDVPVFLEAYNWCELEQMNSQEFTSRYVQPAGRRLPVMDIERSVFAVKM